MARSEWTRQDIDDRLGDASQQLRQTQEDPAVSPTAVQTIQQNIDWLLDKRNRAET